MTDINLTPARLEILQAVARGEVIHLRNWHSRPNEEVWRPNSGGHKRVTAAVNFLKDAGLVCLGPASSPSMYASKPWLLTEAGEHRLARAEQESRR